MNAFAARGIDSYRHTEIQSRTPLELVVRLYDGALRFMTEARDATARRDVLARSRAVNRTLAILAELQGALDLESGGTIAASLDALYTYVASRLMDACFGQDVRPIDEAMR